VARLPYLDKSDLAPEHRDLLSRDITLYRALAHSPGALKSLSAIGGYIRHKSTLDPKLRELAILQVGYLARSPYEWSHHVKIGHDFGLSDDDIRAIAEETAGRATKLDPLARLVLRAAREITNDLAMSDATFAALGAQLSREHMVDLTMTIAFYNAVVRVLATLQIDVEPEYQRYLEEHPLPKG
jgi:alkylhydroperoxidase family enzyme